MNQLANTESFYLSRQIYNPFLNIAVKLGILGLVSFIFLFYSLIKLPLKLILKKPNSSFFDKKLVLLSVFYLNYLFFYQGVNWFTKGEMQLAFILVLFMFINFFIRLKLNEK